MFRMTLSLSSGAGQVREAWAQRSCVKRCKDFGNAFAVTNPAADLTSRVPSALPIPPPPEHRVQRSELAEAGERGVLAAWVFDPALMPK